MPRKKNFFEKNLWNMLNTLLALFAVVIGLLNYFSDMPSLSQDIVMELLATNPNSRYGDMLIFTVDYSNTGKQPLPLKDIDCNLFLGEKNYECMFLNPFRKESIQKGHVFPLSVQPGKTKRLVLYFVLIKKNKGSDLINNIKEIVSQNPEYILTPIDSSGNKYPSKRKTLEAHVMSWDKIRKWDKTVFNE
jgi:hypothetical protein